MPVLSSWLNFMVKGKIFLLAMSFSLFSSCTSRLLVSTNNCYSKGRWNTVEREFNTSIGDKFASEIRHQKKYFDHVFVERIWTPLGQLSREKLHLEELLRLNGMNCSQIKSIEITYFNDYLDVITSVIPFLSSRSVMLKIHTL